MLDNKNNVIEDLLYRKIDKTLYEISVKQSENAKESFEDILLRLIVSDADSDQEEKIDGEEQRNDNSSV